MSDNLRNESRASEFGEVRVTSRPRAAPLPTEEERATLREKNLHYNVAHGYSEDVRRLLYAVDGEARLSLVNSPLDEGGETLLHVAADGGFLDTVRMLLEAGAVVDVKEVVTGRSALAYSVAQGHWEVVCALLDAGASATGVDSEVGDDIPPELLKRLKSE